MQAQHKSVMKSTSRAGGEGEEEHEEGPNPGCKDLASVERPVRCKARLVVVVG